MLLRKTAHFYIWLGLCIVRGSLFRENSQAPYLVCSGCECPEASRTLFHCCFLRRFRFKFSGRASYLLPKPRDFGFLLPSFLCCISTGFFLMLIWYTLYIQDFFPHSTPRRRCSLSQRPSNSLLFR